MSNRLSPSPLGVAGRRRWRVYNGSTRVLPATCSVPAALRDDRTFERMAGED